MYSPNLGRPLATSEVPKKYVLSEPRVRRSSCLSFLRGSLLGWAFLRLVVSVLWTGVIIIATVAPFLSPEHRAPPPSRLYFGAFAVVVQLVEFGMIVTFITAGVQKSASLYRVYKNYCILTLIIYIISVILCFKLDYENGHYFGDIYLTYQAENYVFLENDGDVFLIAAILDICMEICLIFAVRSLIREYSYNKNYAADQNI